MNFSVSLVLIFLSACGGATGNPSADMTAPPDMTSPSHVVVPATAGTLALPFTMTATGAGTSRLGAITLANSVGTIEIDGTALPAFVFEQQAWPDQGYTLYQTLIVGDDRWYVAWLYCNAVGAIDSAYFEGTDGTQMILEDATGTCNATTTASTVAVQLPATTMDVTLIPGFVANGTAITVAGATPGRLRIAGVDQVLLPFDVVDCTRCAAVGWYELHSIASDAAGHATFVILYFWPSEPTTIEAAYALTLPTLKVPFDTFDMTGTWTYTAPDMRHVGSAPPPPRQPWRWAPPSH